MVKKAIVFCMGRIKLLYWLVFIHIFFSVGCNSFAQEDQMKDNDYFDNGLKMAEQKFFFDALRLRTDLNFESQKRILYTTIKDIKAFRKQYRGSQMTMEYAKEFEKMALGAQWRLTSHLGSTATTM